MSAELSNFLSPLSLQAFSIPAYTLRVDHAFVSISPLQTSFSPTVPTPSGGLPLGPFF